MPIEFIKEIIFRDNTDRYAIDIPFFAVDSFNNEMQIGSLYVYTRGWNWNEKQEKKYAQEWERINDLLKLTTVNNHKINVLNMPKSSMESGQVTIFKKPVPKKKNILSSENSKIHWDEQLQHYIENGVIVDKFGRPLY